MLSLADNLKKPNDPRSWSDTLGFFARGVPAIFVQNNIAFFAYPEMHDYLTYRTKYDKKQANSADFGVEPIPQGFEYYITHLHEAKHFHDALLSPVLFLSFINQFKKTLHVLQIISQAGKKRPRREELPIRHSGLKKITPARHRPVLDSLKESERKDRSRISAWFEPSTLNNVTFETNDIIEASAITLELGYLLHTNGTDAARAYYNDVILQLPDCYTKLLKWVNRITDDIETTTIILLCLIPQLLYTMESPAARFTKFAKGLTAPKQIFERLESLGHPKVLFQDEDKIKDHIARINYQSTDPKYQIDSHILSELLDEIGSPTELYQARADLISRWVNSKDMRLDFYLEHFNQLPAPPVVFIPDLCGNTEFTAIPEAEFKLRFPTHYILRGQFEDIGPVVISGMIPLAQCPPTIEMSHVDMALLSRYVYERLIRTNDIIYAPSLDRVYEDILCRRFLK